MPASTGPSNNGVGSQRSSEQERWADKEVFTTGEAAQVCNVSQQTIIRCFDSGRLTGFRVPGSRFRRIPREELIRFMRENDIPTDMIDVSEDTPAATAGPPRILVVDDDPQIIEVFTEMLERAGKYEVRSARTGYDAGMLTESFRPHLIVLDYMLPDVNGNVVCEQLRSREEFKETRIIFVSGVIGRDEIDKLKSAGADDFVAKPFDLNMMLGKIDSLLPTHTL
ncbi:MAG: response regulator [Planctomycetota bacterium]